jgi:hypothetical protein
MPTAPKAITLPRWVSITRSYKLRSQCAIIVIVVKINSLFQGLSFVCYLQPHPTVKYLLLKCCAAAQGGHMTVGGLPRRRHRRRLLSLTTAMTSRATVVPSADMVITAGLHPPAMQHLVQSPPFSARVPPSSCLLLTMNATSAGSIAKHYLTLTITLILTVLPRPHITIRTLISLAPIHFLPHIREGLPSLLLRIPTT